MDAAPFALINMNRERAKLTLLNRVMAKLLCILLMLRFRFWPKGNKLYLCVYICENVEGSVSASWWHKVDHRRSLLCVPSVA